MRKQFRKYQLQPVRRWPLESARHRHCAWVFLMLLHGVPSLAVAQESEVDDWLSVDVHGFVSQGFIFSTDNNYLAESERGSFEFTEVGVNFTKYLTDELRVGIQLFARDLGPIGNYDARMDWFYLDYRFTDWLGLRAGRVKIPFGLYNEFNDIDQARVPILLPQSVYPIESRDFLLAQTGAELYGHVRLADAGALEYRLFAGTIFLDVESSSQPFEITDFGVPYVVGGRLLWETPVDGLRVGGSIEALRLDADLLFNGTDAVIVKLPAQLWVASIEYAAHDLLLAAEYGRWHVDVDSSDTALFPSTPVITSERAFAMAAYRFTPWLQPGVYYSLLYPDVGDRSGRDAMQHDIAATLRFDLNEFWLLKLEAHYMHGTAALRPELNDNTPQAELTRNWVLFMAKTTAYF